MEKLEFYKRYISLPVCKKSNKFGNIPKPFKSGKKINTIKGVVEHPFLFSKKALAFIFEEDDAIVACEGCRILPNIEIDFSVVKRLYPNCVIIRVDEYYIQSMKWIKNNFPDISLDEQIRDCLFQHAEIVNLEIKHEGKIITADYKLSELVTKSSLVS